MNPEPPSNPYAPPIADVTAPAAQKIPAVSRPLPVRWALVFFTLGLLLAAAGYLLLRQMMAQFNAGSDNQVLIIFLAIRVVPYAVPLAFLLFAGRHPVAYWVTVIALAWLCCTGLFTLGSHVASEEPPQQTSQKLLMVFILVVNLLTAWLFYCFTFGRPSRLYFRVLKL